MFRVHGEVTPVEPDQECGRIVIALLEVRMQDRGGDLRSRNVVDGYLNATPAWIGCAGNERHRWHERIRRLACRYPR